MARQRKGTQPLRGDELKHAVAAALRHTPRATARQLVTEWREFGYEASFEDTQLLLGEIRSGLGRRPTASKPAKAPPASTTHRPAPSVPPALPRQVARHPSFPSTPMHFSSRPLSSGRPSMASWGELSHRLRDTIEDVFVDRVEVVATTPGQRHGFVFARIVDHIPYFVAWSVLVQERFDSFQADGWHIWLPRDVASWDEPSKRLSQLPPAGEPIVATWRSETPLEVTRAVLHMVYDRLGVKWPSHLELDVRRVEGKAAEQRRHELAEAEGAGQAGRTHRAGFVHEVGGFCRLCGLPLRDPLSLQRGYGPECWERVRDSDGLLNYRRPDIPSRRWVGAVDATKWRQSVRREVLAALSS